MGDRFFTGAHACALTVSPLPPDSTPFCVTSAPSAPVHHRSPANLYWSVSTGRDIHFALRASAAALGKVAVFTVRGPPLSREPLLLSVVRRASGKPPEQHHCYSACRHRSRMTFRQQYSVLCQRGGAGRRFCPAVICPCVVSVSLATVRYRGPR